MTNAALLAAACVLGAAAANTVVNDGHGDYVLVAAGPFKMGDNFGDGEARERPVHVVELDSFYIAKYEMTNGEWKKFRDDPGYEEVLAGRKDRSKGSEPLLERRAQSRRRHARKRQLSSVGRELGLGHRILQLAEQQDWQEIQAADGSGMGESGTQHRSAPLSLGKRDRPFLGQLCGRAAFRYPIDRRVL
jgi:formylglycine-generating enzyme required for sulfatase activity